MAMIGLILILAAGLIFVAARLNAWGLWSQSSTAEAIAWTPSRFGLSITRQGFPSAVATSRDDQNVKIPLGQADLASLLAATPTNGVQQMAIPFKVAAASADGLGMDYVLSARPAIGQTVLGGSARVSFFQVAKGEDCQLPPVVLSDYVPGSQVSATIAGKPGQQFYQQDWCAVLSLTPPTYTNKVMVNGSDLAGALVSAGDQWSAHPIDLSDEPDDSLSIVLLPTDPQSGPGAHIYTNVVTVSGSQPGAPQLAGIDSWQGQVLAPYDDHIPDAAPVDPSLSDGGDG
jgi:hypothetical protein